MLIAAVGTCSQRAPEKPAGVVRIAGRCNLVAEANADGRSRTMAPSALAHPEGTVGGRSQRRSTTTLRLRPRRRRGQRPNAKLPGADRCHHRRSPPPRQMRASRWHAQAHQRRRSRGCGLGLHAHRPTANALCFHASATPDFAIASRTRHSGSRGTRHPAKGAAASTSGSRCLLRHRRTPAATRRDRRGSGPEAAASPPAAGRFCQRASGQ